MATNTTVLIIVAEIAALVLAGILAVVVYKTRTELRESRLGHKSTLDLRRGQSPAARRVRVGSRNRDQPGPTI